MNEVISIFESITILSIIKVMIVIMLIIYNIFAYLMMRQIRAMNRAVEIGDSLVMWVIGVVHFLFAMLVLLVAVIAL